MLTERGQLQAARSTPSGVGKSPRDESCRSNQNVLMSGFVLSCGGGEKYPKAQVGRAGSVFIMERQNQASEFAG